MDRIAKKTRPNPSRLTGPALVLALGAVLGGCALSPQTVQVAPAPEVTPQDIGAGRGVALSVVDTRERDWFGRRGGIYDTSYVQPSGDITLPVREAIGGALSQYGFRVQAAGEPADLSMMVDIGAIDYEATGTPAMTTVTTRADLGVVLRSPRGEEYSGRSKVSQSKDVALVPDARQNGELINQTLSRAIERMLQQPDVLRFLQQR